MNTVAIVLIVVTSLVCVGVGFYIAWVNRGYERRKAEAEARKRQTPDSTST